MQYKIPVQIENEDPIFLGLSLRQLAILMAGFGFAFMIFKSLEPNTGPQIAAIPAIIVALIAATIALVKMYEMTFIPLMLAFLRLSINIKERHWIRGIDSFNPLDIGNVTPDDTKTDDVIDMSSKIEKLQTLENNLDKI